MDKKEGAPLMKACLLSVFFCYSLLLCAENAFATISYGPPQTYVAHTLITQLNPTITGGTATNFIVTPAMPAGLSLANSNGKIQGTPTVATGPIVYTVTATGTGGGTCTLIITVSPRVNSWNGTATGANLNLWTANGNWSAGTPPDEGDEAQIGVSLSFTNQPIVKAAPPAFYQLTFGSVTAGTVTINSGLSLDVSNIIGINGGAAATLTGAGSITAGSLAFNSGTSSLALNLNLPVTNDVTINSGASATITGTGNITAASLTYPSGTGSLTLNGGYLTVSNNFTVNTGTAATIAGSANVNIGPLATLNVNGTGTLTTNLTGKLTLKSDATGSACVGQILPTSITGSGADSIHVERFMTGGIVPVSHRGYYLMSSPVYAATVSSNPVYDLHYLIYNGIYLTGLTGFDKVGNPSLYLYREDRPPSNATFVSGNFWGISKFNNINPYDYNLNQTATTYNIPAGNGYLLFFRGSRNGFTLAQETQTTFTSAPTVTLSASGTLNAGQISYHAWYRPALATLAWSNATSNSSIRGFNLLGNPYASTIDWESFNTTTSTSGIYASNTNVGNTIYEYNPVNHVYETYQKGGASSGNATRYIASGQGFFIQTSVDSTAQLIFNESAKVTNQNTGLNLFMSTRANMAKVTGNASEQHLRLQMAKDSVNVDNIYIGFNSAASTKYVFNEDAPYKVGTSVVTLASLSSDNVLLTINKVPLPTLIADVIPLNVTATTSGTYRLKMSDVQTMSAIYEIWLKDAYTKDSLDMRQNPSYTFDVNVGDPASFGSGRFSLVIRENPALGVHLLDFTAGKVATGSQLNWTTENEKNYTGFTIERSAGGSAFSALGSFNSSGQGTYGFVDMNPLLGVNMYRLKLVDLNGTVTYSKVVSVTYNQLQAADGHIRVYPNPVKNVLKLFVTSSSQQANLSAGITSPYKESEKVGEYSITIVNNSGTVLKRDVSNQAAWQTDVSNFMPGSYIIQVISKNGKGVMGQCVFIKL